MNELGIQTLLCNAGNELGGHFFKCSNRFRKGVPDLSCQLPGECHAYIEVKFARRFSKGLRRPDLTRADWKAIMHVPCVRLDMTVHQRRFMADHLVGGGTCGWLMVVGTGNRDEYVMDCSFRTPSHGVLYYRPEEGDNQWLVKRRGEKWPVAEVVRRLNEARREPSAASYIATLSASIPVPAGKLSRGLKQKSTGPREF